MPIVTLNQQEKNGLRSAVGSEGAILTATVARLYVADPDPGTWRYTGIMGALTLTFDKRACVLSLRIYDLRSFKIAFSQELYENFNYQTPRPYFHVFEADEYMCGISFTHPGEADGFSRKLRANTPKPGKKVQLVSNNSGSRKKKNKEKKKGLMSRMFGGSEKEEGPRLEISGPTNFQHLGHIGWDPNQGFDVRNIPPEWRRLFDKAGVTDAQLQNPETSAFIVDFVTKNAPSGMPPLQQQGGGGGPPGGYGGGGGRGGPPPPPGGGYGGGGGGYGGRGGPPPPPGGGGGYGGGGRGGPPPPPPGRGGYGGQQGGYGGGRGGLPPPPMGGGGGYGGQQGGYGGGGGGGGYGAPAPPPPPPGAPAPPPPPPPGGMGGGSRGGGGGGGGGGRGGLLSAIQSHGGVGNLQATETREPGGFGGGGGGGESEAGMAGALAAALAGRRLDIADDSNEDDDDWDDDEDWE